MGIDGLIGPFDTIEDPEELIQELSMSFENKLYRCFKREQKLTVNKNLRAGLNKSGYPLPDKCSNFKCRKYREKQHDYI